VTVGKASFAVGEIVWGSRFTVGVEVSGICVAGSSVKGTVGVGASIEPPQLSEGTNVAYQRS